MAGEDVNAARTKGTGKIQVVPFAQDVRRRQSGSGLKMGSVDNAPTH